MKAHLRQPALDTSDAGVLNLLESEKLDVLLQSRINTARKKENEIIKGATERAASIEKSAQQNASNMVKKATEKAAEIRAEAVQETRAIKVARNELRDSQSILAHERRLFDDKVAKFSSAMTTVLASWTG